MKIISMRLENFQGIRDMVLRFDGKSAAIYGRNEAGKTTIYNAITWLLFGQSSTGAKNFTPKTIDRAGEVHNLNHSVEAVYACADGSEITLKRLFHEVYTKQRGSASSTFSGHTTEYFIDDVPKSEKEYNETLERLCGSVSTMRLLTIPDYFPDRLEWKERRKLLIDICGDVTDDDVIDADSELQKLRVILRKPGNTQQLYSVDEYRAIAQRSMTDINKELQSIPDRIDEATKAIPADLASATASWSDADLEVSSLRLKLADLEAKKSGGAVSVSEHFRTQLLSAKNNLEEARTNYYTEADKATRAEREQIRNAETAVFHKQSDLQSKEDELETLRRRRSSMIAKREKLTQEYNAVFARTYSGDDTCPSCGQALPADAIDAAVATFNAHKSEELAEINARGKECSKDKIADLDSKIAALESSIASARADLEKASVELTGQKAEQTAITPFEKTPLFTKLSESIESAQQRIDNTKQMRDTVSDELDRQIAEIRGELQELERLCAKYELRQAQTLRISELNSREKELAGQYERQEQGMALCELFVRSKVSMLNSRINNKFRHVSFILFVEQINGGLKECCEVAIPAADGSLIPFAFANTAARINAGLEIISVLSAHFGVSLPVVVDNAESVTYLDGRGIEQLIRLIVSAGDESLRLEVA